MIWGCIGLVLAFGVTVLNGEVQNFESESPVDYTCHFYTQCCKNVEVTDSQQIVDADSRRCGSGYTWVVTAKDSSSHLLFKLTKFNRNNRLNILSIATGERTWTFPFDSTEVDDYIVTNSTRVLVDLDSAGKYSDSSFTLQITTLKHGGSYHNNGTFHIYPDSKKPITKPIDSYFALDVPANRQVITTINKFTDVPNTAYVQFFDGFSNKTEIGRFYPGSQFYPVFSMSNTMLIVARNFTNNSTLSASFNNVLRGSNKISLDNFGSYELTDPLEKGNAYAWLIKPSAAAKSDFISLTIDTLSLSKDDYLVISLGLSPDMVTKIQLLLNESLTSPRSLMVPAADGIRLDYYVKSGLTNTPNVYLAAYYKVVTGCGTAGEENLQTQNLRSLGYPNQYFLNSKCTWTFSIPSDKVAHVTVKDLDADSDDKLTFASAQQPTPIVLTSATDDFIVTGSMQFNWSTSLNGITHQPHRGFSLDLRVTDCGGNLDAPNKFSTPGYPKPAKGIECHWLLTAPRQKSEVNNIRLIVTIPSSDHELQVYDGGSTRNEQLVSKIVNDKAVFVSRKDKLLVTYMSQKGTPISASFVAQDCSEYDRCDNGICMHPDWRCNGLNDCGDFSDEKYCPKKKGCQNATTITIKDGETVNVTTSSKDIGMSADCIWKIEAENASNTLVIQLKSMTLKDREDLIILADGASGQPLNFFTSASKPGEEIVITTSNKLSVTFATDLLHKDSNFTLSITSQDNSGNMSKTGDIVVVPKHETEIVAFVLNVDEPQVVVNVSHLNINETAVVNFYDGVKSTSEKLLATFKNSGDVHPIFSKTNRVLVVARNFDSKSNFTATFHGKSGTDVFSQESSGTYELKESIPAGEHTWIIKPSKIADADLISLTINALLNKDDVLTISTGVGSKTETLLELKNSLPGQRSLYSLAKQGITVVYNRAKTDADKVDFSASYQVVSGCKNLNATGAIQSPGYPNQYYFNANCSWNIDVKTNKFIHLMIKEIDPAVNDTLNLAIGKEKPQNLSSRSDDLVFNSSSVLTWATGTNGINEILLNKGFLLNLEENDCGGNNDAPGWVSSPNYPKTATKNYNCTWVINANRQIGHVNNIYLQITSPQGSDLPLRVFDGSNTNSQEIHYKLTKGVANITSRTNKLLLKYSSGETGTPFNATYIAHTCPKAEQCDHNICMHPDWICNGVNECKDGTDEKNCVPYEDCGNAVMNATGSIQNFSYNIKTATGRPANCRWMIQAETDKTIIVLVEAANLVNEKDMLIFRDGDKDTAPKIFSLSNGSKFQQVLLVTSKSAIWINMFSDQVVSGSAFTINFRSQAIGRRMEGNGTIQIPTKQPGNQTLFFEFEVEESMQVEVDFSVEGKSNDWHVAFIDGYYENVPFLAGFDKDKAIYPVIASSNKMLVAVKDIHGDASAKMVVKEIPQGFNFIHQKQSDTFNLATVTPNTYTWTINPPILPGESLSSVISLSLNKWDLKDKDVLEISELGKTKNPIATFYSTIDRSHVVYIPRKSGAHITYSTKNNGSVSVAASYEVVSGCNDERVSLKLYERKVITSPNYPNLYPSDANCVWKFDVPKNKSVVHITFNDIDLAVNHSIKITTNGVKQLEADGSILPDDLVVDGNKTVIEWDSSVFHEKITNGRGFSITVELLDCGETLTKPSEKFGTPSYPHQPSENVHCMWLVSLPPKGKGDHLNLVDLKFNFTGKNHNLEIFDGGSIRANDTKDSENPLLSRTNKVLFSYKFDQTKKDEGTAYEIDYKTFLCGDEHCQNGICMHKEWRCNGINDCLDNSDEVNCNGTEPVPTGPGPTAGPTPKPPSPSAGWIVGGIFFGIFLGIILALVVPILFRKFRGNSPGYSRFNTNSEAT